MALTIDRNLWNKKAEIIEYFRKRGEESGKKHESPH